jgi:mannose-6-phosphate isomerase
MNIVENTRPWGEYEILHEANNYKVKKITVNPGGKLSYQFHHKRNEVWAITEGTGIFTLNGVSSICSSGMTLNIPTLAKHMIENTGVDPLVFIEVQRGTYFGEDDIVRIEDIYGRK